MSEFYIGVMSGTSLDGVDIAYCEAKEDEFRLVYAKTYTFDEKLKKDILEAIEGNITLKSLGELDIRLGRLFSSYIDKFLIEFSIEAKDVSAIGLHGQTLWHEPNGDLAFSMQLGDANTLNANLGIRVVSDFRQKDVSLGGQGAPLAPAFHNYIFKKHTDKTAVLNIGGMANITILGENLIGYDTGCGNVLMDYWIFKHKNLPYDRDGEWAKSGNANDVLLQKMLNEPYFKKPYPKSTGRELFNKEWLENRLEGFLDLKPQDVQATLLELCATTMSDEAIKNNIQLLIVCGGGAKNDYLMQRLNQKLLRAISSDEAGVSSEFMEAMAFAWFARERLHKRAIKISSVTGAKKDTILGAIYE
jgi:anhydro-N-acetylmuramic acid kinase